MEQQDQFSEGTNEGEMTEQRQQEAQEMGGQSQPTGSEQADSNAMDNDEASGQPDRYV